MKRKTFLLPLIVLGLLSFIAAADQSSSALVTINKITVQPGKLSTRIILETNAPLSPVNTYYSAETIVVELGQVNSTTQPPVQLGDPQLVTGITIEKADNNQARVLVQLREQVPYRIFGNNSMTVIELNKMQKGQGEYVIEPEAQQLLDKNEGVPVIMEKHDVMADCHRGDQTVNGLPDCDPSATQPAV